jgi:hypothetical protein
MEFGPGSWFDSEPPESRPSDTAPAGQGGDQPLPQPEPEPQPEADVEPMAADLEGVPVVVPEELSALPPGALLAEVLDEIPVDRVSGHDSVVVLSAAYRQLCRQQAVFYQAMAETGLRAPGSASMVARLSAPGEFACEEARAALVWSRQRSEREYRLGFDLFIRLPELGAALHAAQVDLPRARAFVEWTDGLTDAQAATIITGLLPQAASVVVGELIDQIKRAAIAVDPEWAERRYKAAVKTRRVRGYRNPDGTANLGGYAQPTDRVVAACGRIDRLARACKSAGDRRAIDLIRSDLYLRMLDGTFEAMTDTDVIAHVIAHPLDDYTGAPDHVDTSDDTEGDEPDTGQPGSSDEPDDDGEPDDGGPDDGGPDGSGAPAPGDAAADAGDAAACSADTDPTEPEPTEPEPTEPEPTEPAGPEPADPGPGKDATPTGAASASAAAGVGCAVPELRVQLMTLLGRGEAPGQLAGWDYIPAWLARRLAQAMITAQWRWVVCGPDGHAVDGGVTTSRPDGSRNVRRDRRRGGILELAVTETDLRGLAAGLAAGGVWASVVADIDRQFRYGRAGPDHRPEPPAGADQPAIQAGRRVPSARLRRWVELRDRVCGHPCCRAPAVGADIDHRVGWAAGGPTLEHNLGPVCRRDHRIKDGGGWRMLQTGPWTKAWISPLGLTSTVRTPPVIPAPTPELARDDGLAADHDHWRDSCACPIRPCRHHDDKTGDISGQNGALATTESQADQPHGERSDTPYLDHLRRQRHAREPFYEDEEPPF